MSAMDFSRFIIGLQPYATFSKMEMQLSPFCAAIFGIFIMQ